jgi:hypothetical protein
MTSYYSTNIHGQTSALITVVDPKRGGYAKVRYFIHFGCKILSFTNVILNFCRQIRGMGGAAKYLLLDQRMHVEIKRILIRFTSFSFQNSSL